MTSHAAAGPGVTVAPRQGASGCARGRAMNGNLGCREGREASHLPAPRPTAAHRRPEPHTGQSPTQAGGAPCWGASASCPPFRLPWLRASQKEWRWLASADPLSRSGLSPEEAAGFNPSMVTVLKWDLVND